MIAKSPTRSTVLTEAVLTADHLRGGDVARRRFQNPVPIKRGGLWTIRIWQDVIVDGAPVRKQKRITSSETMSVRDAQKWAQEQVAPSNQGLVAVGSGVKFGDFVRQNYLTGELPGFASTTQASYRAMLNKYLLPTFETMMLRELTRFTLQSYFAGLADRGAGYRTVLKVRDALASVLNYAHKGGILVINPLIGMRRPRDNRPVETKTTITREQFHQLLMLIQEPYATAVHTAALTGLRVSEVLALKWKRLDIAGSKITVAERYTRGDWDKPKSRYSQATIPVPRAVIDRLLRLKIVTLRIRAGLATRQYPAVRDAGPDGLIFQAPQTGGPLDDQNVLKRHLQPAAAKIGIAGLGWHTLRRSFATWLIEGGANPKAVQSLLRHSRVETTLNLYSQVTSEGQRQALEGLEAYAPPAVELDGHDCGHNSVTIN